jgi:hypothetical protein
MGAGAVIDYETFCKIKHYREEEHLTLAQTARSFTDYDTIIQAVWEFE